MITVKAHFLRVSAWLSVIVVLLNGLLPGEAIGCTTDSTHFACDTGLGEYYILRPVRTEPLKRSPVVVILHDAGRDAAEILMNEKLVSSIIVRGYAVIVPVATKRKYVRTVQATIDSRLSEYSINRRVTKSDRKYMLQTPEGDLRPLKQGQDRGWYFANTDAKVVKHADGIYANREATPKGRDEAAFLSGVLTDASLRFGVNDGNVIVIGLGHGAALTWQLACASPGMATIFAPVNGAFWMRPPVTCMPGGRVVYTHQKGNRFWPFEGSESTPKLFGQAAVWETAEAFAKTQACRMNPTQEASEQLGVTWHIWQDCPTGSIQLNVLKEEFAFQDWWLDDVIGTDVEQTNVEPQADHESGLVKPRFMKPKSVSKI